MPITPEQLPESASPIVIIDDDPDDQFFIRRGISRGGILHPIKAFPDGTEAVTYFAQRREAENPDTPACVIFCDIKMSRMNGFEVLRWFRGNAVWAGVSFYMLSGSNEPADRALADSLGATGYFVKFPTDAEFAHIIASAVLTLRSARPQPKLEVRADG